MGGKGTFRPWCERESLQNMGYFQTGKMEKGLPVSRHGRRWLRRRRLDRWWSDPLAAQIPDLRSQMRSKRYANLHHSVD
ncbi:hypothetical protein U1Q18_029417 [Sarracenia purpurea var. burkii]